MRQTVQQLKARPKDERIAIASGIAIGVVILLLVAWGFVFFKNISREPSSQGNAGQAENTVEFQSFQQAADSFTESYNAASSQLQRIREEAEALRGQREDATSASFGGTTQATTTTDTSADTPTEPTESAFDVE